MPLPMPHDTIFRWPVRYEVVAQLEERSLPTPEVRGSNPVIGKLYKYLFTILKSRK